MVVPDRWRFMVTVLICLVIFIACLLMAGPMRQGLPVAGDLAARLQYIADNLVLWQLGWLCWMVAAVGLLCFCHLLASALPTHELRTFSLALVTLGIVPDLTAQTLYAFLLPAMSQLGAVADTLLLLDQLALYLTGFLGNGLYNLGGLGLTLLLLRYRPDIKSWVYPGIMAWILGLGLSTAIALQQLAVAELLTAASMTLSTLWFALIAYRLWGPSNV